MLEIGADVNWRNTDGDTPLLAACRRGHTDTIGLLLSHGADSNLIGNDGYAPIHICSRRGDVNSVDVLLNANTNTTLKTKNGQTALDIAKEKGHEAVYARIMRQRSGISRNPPLSHQNSLNSRSREDLLQASLPSVGRSDLPSVTGSQNRGNLTPTNGNNNNTRRSTSYSSDSGRSNGGDSCDHPSTERLLSSFGNNLTARSERSLPNSRVTTTEEVGNVLRPIDPPKRILKDELSSNSGHIHQSNSNNKNYSIIGSGSSTSNDDPSALIALRRLLDSEKVAKNILEAKLEVFATQNKQLVEEYRFMSDELANAQDIIASLRKKVHLYEGRKEEIDLLTIDDCEESEKLLKKTLAVLEDRKVRLIIYFFYLRLICIFLFSESFNEESY